MLVTDGVFRSDGTFVRAVLRQFARLPLDARVAALGLPCAPRRAPRSRRRPRSPQLARYAARAPVALERLQYDAAKKKVRLVSDKLEGPTAGTNTFEALEFLALLLAHVPDHHEILVRYYG